jgi:thioredoxin reductase/SAM-dependent methyltransferase
MVWAMSNHATRTAERHCDVCIIGGSAAGLAAALQLGRQRRSVIVVDSGEPRNGASAHMHGYLTRDGLPPSELIAAGREEVRGYGGEVLAGLVSLVSRTEAGDFRVELAGGHSIIARRVLAAAGLVDELPDIDGLTEHWGRDVIHCPFCHGYEFRDRRIVQIVTHPTGLHTAGLFRQLSAQLTVVLHDPADVDDAELDALRASGVKIAQGKVSRIVMGTDGHVAGVELADHGSIAADAVAVGPRFRVRAEPFASLGLRPAAHPTGLGDFLETDATGATTVPGLYAAGSATDPGQQVLQAAADGSRVGAVISFSLASDDIQAAARPSANESDWDHRYQGDPMWSGNPNGTLVNEISGLAPGRALDVGAGEGGDALWLAEQGWSVTANDISQRALDRVSAEAGRRGLRVECHRADANARDAFETAAFDLVSAQYASIPRTPDGRGVRNLLNAVAPGGTLLIVSHDLEPVRAPVGAPGHSQPFDPDAYARVDDFAAALAGSPAWDIELHEKRLRPAGAASASHHVHDIVLRARRRATLS